MLIMLKTSSDVLKLISSSLSPLTSVVVGAPQMALQQYVLNVFEPGHEKTCLMPYANNKGADQQIVVRCLDSIISLDSIAEISRLYLASVAAQAGLCLAWSETPEDTLCRVVVHLYSWVAFCQVKRMHNVATFSPTYTGMYSKMTFRGRMYNYF